MCWTILSGEGDEITEGTTNKNDGDADECEMKVEKRLDNEDDVEFNDTMYEEDEMLFNHSKMECGRYARFRR